MPGFRPALAGDHQIVAAARQLDEVGDVFVGRVGLFGAARDRARACGTRRSVGNGAADAAEADHAHASCRRRCGRAGSVPSLPSRPRARSGRRTGSGARRRASGRWRDRRTSSVNTPGVLVTGMLRSRAAARSTVSVPTPKIRDDLELRQRRDQRAVGAAIGLGRDRPDAALELGAQHVGRRRGGSDG